MAEPIAPPPKALAPLEGLDPGPIPTAAALALAPDPCPGRQRGGRREGLALLESFLAERGARYHRELSSPVTAFASCSRLSAHLAWGTLSMREVIQASRRRGAALRALPAAERAECPRALRGFEERLHWHCHFIQKLESQPDLEFRSLHPLSEAGNSLCPRTAPDAAGPEGVVGNEPAAQPASGPRGHGSGRGVIGSEGVMAQRGAEPTEPIGADDGLSSEASAHLAAWAEGRTGLPFVDACMRALIATGWINFRMRAMLMSVASYQLWLPWRESGLVLARLFVDYEPGIHWSQCQMQSGTTGINSIRVYNPIKQGQDHDPQGLFLRRWLPELERVPGVHLHEPWTMPLSTQTSAGCVLGVDYPLPLVDPAAAAREAKQRIWARRQEPGFRELAATILQNHGSRRSSRTRGPRAAKRGRQPRPTPETDATRPLQLGLDLDLG